MEEYVVANIAQQSIDKCRGRYKAMPKPSTSPEQTTIATAGKALDACDFAAIKQQQLVLSTPRFASDAKARALLAKMAAENQAQKDLDAVRKTLAAGDLVKAKSQFQKLRPTTCTRKGIVDVGAEIQRIDSALADADAALRTCEAPRVAAAGRQLAQLGYSSLAGKLKSLDAVATAAVQAPALQEEAKADYRRGQVSKAEAKLSVRWHNWTASRASRRVASCVERSLTIGSDRPELGRVVTAAAAAINSCDVGRMQDMSRQFAGVSHPTLTGLKRVMDELMAGVGLYEQAKQSYSQGDIGGAKSQLQRSVATIRKTGAECANLKKRIADNLDKIAQLEKVVATAQTAINSCDAGRMRDMSRQFASVNHPTLAGLKRKMDELTAGIDLYERAKQSYSRGDVGGAKSLLQQSAAAIDKAGAQCTDLKKRIADNLEKIAQLEKVAATAEAAIRACDVSRMQDMSRQFGSVGHPTLIALKRNMDEVTAGIGLYDQAEQSYSKGDLNGAKSQLQRSAATVDKTGAQCADLKKRIADSLEKIAQLEKVLGDADLAIRTCAIEGINILHAKFTSHPSHPLIREKIHALERQRFIARPMKSTR